MLILGITGLAQIRVRNDATWDERIKIDIEYVNRITMYEDIKILIKTVLYIFKKKDVYGVCDDKIKEKNKQEEVTK